VNKIKNIFDIKNIQSKDQEVFESLLNTSDIRVDRIITLKPYDKSGKWYDQETNEWVLLMQGEAELEFEDDEKIALKSGDYIFIPAHKKHRINYSSSEPKCIWLAIYGELK
jgi:cupin 2 domain-containing protein